LARDKFICRCEKCRAADRICVATEVDHIVSKAVWKARYGTLAGVDDPSNLQAISTACHQLKTVLEKGHQPRMGFDANGLPRDPNHPWNRERRAEASDDPASTPDAPDAHHLRK